VAVLFTMSKWKLLSNYLSNQRHIVCIARFLFVITLRAFHTSDIWFTLTVTSFHRSLV